MFKPTLLLISAVAVLSATNTTMCFKKNHLDPSNIESIALEGGECLGKYTVEDMQRAGYRVHDIKISSGDEGLNYIYIFQKGQPQVATTTMDGKYILSKEELRAKFEEIQEEQRVEKEEKERIANISLGKEIYEGVCRSCHGDGTISAYGVATPLVQLNETQIIDAFRDYSFGQKDNGMAILMKPYASRYNQSDLKAISAYIRTTLIQAK